MDAQPLEVTDRERSNRPQPAFSESRMQWNLRFAASHLMEQLQIEVKHADDFVMDLVELNEKRAALAFRELRARKKNPPWERDELIRRTRESGMIQTSLWLGTQDVSALI